MRRSLDNAAPAQTGNWFTIAQSALSLHCVPGAGFSQGKIMHRLPRWVFAALFGALAASICHGDPSVEETPNAEISRQGGLQMTVSKEASHRESVRFSWPGVTGRSHWDVPASALKRAMPCSDPQEASYGMECAALPELLAFDPKRRYVFIDIAEDSGQNVPIAVLLVRLDARDVRLILEAYGSGMSSASLSPDGRYLAYAMGNHAIGTCNEGTRPGVLDIVRKQELKVPKQPSPRPVAVLTLDARWTSAAHVIFDQNRWNCDDPRHLTHKRTAKLRYDVPGDAAAHR
jgi:hypothetical protein